MHPVIFVCLLLVALGVVVAVRWGGERFAAPDATAPPSALGRAQRALWYIDVHVLAAIAAGLLVIGPGGRLVIRVLAAMADEAAQGRVTEADEVVGRISVDGTIGLVIFVGLFGGLLLAVVAGGLRPWLPRGRLGALCVAALLLLTGATRTDPLRPANPDFDIVGPGWLAVLSFVALIALSALTFEAIATRTARALPLANLRRPLTLIGYVPMILVGATGVLAIAIVVIAVAVAVGAVPTLRRWWDGPLRTAGRVVLVAACVVLVPLLFNDLRAIIDRAG